jgi:hypothetical protein
LSCHVWARVLAWESVGGLADCVDTRQTQQAVGWPRELTDTGRSNSCQCTDVPTYILSSPSSLRCGYKAASQYPLTLPEAGRAPKFSVGAQSRPSPVFGRLQAQGPTQSASRPLECILQVRSGGFIRMHAVGKFEMTELRATGSGDHPRPHPFQAHT